MARYFHLETVTCILPDSVAGFKVVAMFGPALFVSPLEPFPHDRHVSLHVMEHTLTKESKLGLVGLKTAMQIVILPTKPIEQLPLTDFSLMIVTGICQHSLGEVCWYDFSLTSLPYTHELRQVLSARIVSVL